MKKRSVMSIPANIGPQHWCSPSGQHVGRFRPNGVPRLVGPRPAAGNPETWESDEPMLAARLFVGFSVGQEPTYSVDDLVPIVREVRERQGHGPDASFLLQKGIYTSQKDKSVVEEDGAQVIVLNLEGETESKFRREMVELGETIATELSQEAVILEIQKGGVTVRTVGIAPVT